MTEKSKVKERPRPEYFGLAIRFLKVNVRTLRRDASDPAVPAKIRTLRKRQIKEMRVTIAFLESAAPEAYTTPSRVAMMKMREPWLNAVALFEEPFMFHEAPNKKPKGAGS